MCDVCGVILCCCDVCFFFFKQKTAYEMRISDWSSDVCSSDLGDRVGKRYQQRAHAARAGTYQDRSVASGKRQYQCRAERGADDRGAREHAAAVDRKSVV